MGLSLVHIMCTTSKASGKRTPGKADNLNNHHGQNHFSVISQAVRKHFCGLSLIYNASLDHRLGELRRDRHKQAWLSGVSGLGKSVHLDTHNGLL